MCTAIIKDCSSNPCIHGTCTDLVNNYTCTCEAGYDGKNCDNGKATCNDNVVYATCYVAINKDLDLTINKFY